LIEGQSPLLKASTNCSPEMVYRFMMTKGVDFKAIDNFHRNIFHLSAADQRVDFFNYLITIEEDLQLHTILNTKEDTNSWTPLHIAVAKSHFDLVVASFHFSILIFSSFLFVEMEC
jgi:ankyrin repeat protein